MFSCQAHYWIRIVFKPDGWGLFIIKEQQVNRRGFRGILEARRCFFAKLGAQGDYEEVQS